VQLVMSQVTDYIEGYTDVGTMTPAFCAITQEWNMVINVLRAAGLRKEDNTLHREFLMVFANLISAAKEWWNSMPLRGEEFWLSFCLTVVGFGIVLAVILCLPGCAGISGGTLSTATHGAVSVCVTRTPMDGAAA
jgi:hypothetical protein